MAKRHLLITGSPGCGKTTLIIRLSQRLAGIQPVGFFTEEMREGGVRTGFRLVSFDGKEGVLAHVLLKRRSRVGRYGVDVAGFERFLRDLDLEGSPAPLIILDEIGKMECLSPHFVSLVRALLDSGKHVVATIALKGEGVVAEIKGRSDCEVREVTFMNRERLVEDLAEWIVRRMQETHPALFHSKRW